jgi:hypothetical protein
MGVDPSDKTLLEFGKVMSEWSKIERCLFYWFAYATLLDDAPARCIFYSANSFRARVDMLEAVVNLNKLEENETAVIKAGIKRAVQWSAFRNKIAHGEFSFDQQNIVQGKLPPRAAKAKAISFEHLQRARRNFRELSDALYAGLDLTFGPGENADDGLLASLEGCLEVIQSLPSQP